MVQKCVMCGGKVEEEFGKFKGTVVKAKNEKGVNEMLYVCSGCQKDEKWIEKAKVKGA